jgi:hypothetical protein
LDIVKHATNTIIASLDSRDELAIVSFSSHASVCLPLTKMTAEGQKAATGPPPPLPSHRQPQSMLWSLVA